ncbi:EAL domain-containing protein [Methylolobus aquaticus]
MSPAQWDQTHVRDQHRHRFLSLFWKGFLFLSLLMVGIGASFAILNHLHLERQFEEQQKLDKALLNRQLNDLLSRSLTRLQQIGPVLTSVGNVAEALRKKDPRLLRSSASIYTTIQHDLDIEHLELFDASGSAFWQWGLKASTELDSAQEATAIRTVLEREEPSNLLVCRTHCALRVYLPVLVDGRLAGAFALRQSIAQLVIEYQSLTGADIAILIPAAPAETAKGPLAWGYKLAALTHSTALEPLIAELSARNPDELSHVTEVIQNWRGRHFSVHSIPLQAIVHAEAAALIIAEVTDQIDQIHNATRNGIFLASVALLIAELLLFLMMKFPLRHLGRLAESLPLMAQGAYAEAREHLIAAKRTTRWQDEVLILDDAALQLSQQLESQARAIAHKTRELAAERDFVQGLLDAAQVMILTQSSSGRILTANELTLQVTGFEPRELRGRPFRSLILETKVSEEFEEHFAQLWSGQRERLQHETELLCKEGTRRSVVWVHTRLKDQNPNDVAVLSVGLDVTERVEAETRYMWLANHDPLTGLYNRRGFHEELERIYGEVEKSQARAALILFDLDHFKDINDTVGHLAGDELLGKLASELKTRIRKADIAARLGGDEFAILMPHQGLEGAMAFANLLNTRLKTLPITVQQKLFHVSASIGVAVIPDHGSNIEDILANADLAMYQAKNSGRSRVHLFSYSDHARERISDRSYWKQTIQNALLQRRFIFHYQPILSLATGAIPYYEALVRLRGDDGTPIPPSEFLEYAQLTGLIREIDRYVVEDAIRFLSKYRDSGRFTAIHVNLSASALSHRDWTEPLKLALKNREIQPERLIFEITETAAIADFGTAKDIMDELALLGFRFAIDDFGVGFASFSYLRHLPVQFVKIDKSYVTYISGNVRDEAFVSAITTLAHGNKMEVIAEGVEDAETLETIRRLGVDLAQGYFIGRPAPFEVFEEAPSIEAEDKTTEASVPR